MTPYCGLLVALCLVLVSGRGQAANERLVLAVGSNHGLDHEIPLRYAARDAERFVQVMTELGQVGSDDVRLLREPTSAELLDGLGELGERAGASTTLVVYYSGHGSKGALHLQGERLPLARLRGAVGNVRARLRLLLIDACRGTASKGFERDEPFEIQLRNQHKGLVVVHSTGSGDVALESSRLEAGVFSHFLVSGLRGPADFDRDQRVSLNEAYNYARNHTLDRTRRMSGGDGQDPVLDLDIEGAGPVVLTHINRSRSRLILPPGPKTRYVVVETGSQAELVRAWSSTDGAVEIAVPGDQFVVYRAAAREIDGGVAEVTLPFGGTRQLSDRDFQPLESEQGRGRGVGEDAGPHLGSYPGSSLYPHRVSAAVGPLLDLDGHVGEALTLRYVQGTSGWLPIGGVTLSRSEFLTSENEALRTGVRLVAGGQYRRVLPTFNAHAGVGLGVSVMNQRVTSRHGVGARGRLSKEWLAAGLGVQADAGVSLPLRAWLAADLGLVGWVSGFRQAEGDSDERVSPVALDASVLMTVGLSVGL